MVDSIKTPLILAGVGGLLTLAAYGVKRYVLKTEDEIDSQIAKLEHEIAVLKGEATEDILNAGNDILGADNDPDDRSDDLADPDGLDLSILT